MELSHRHIPTDCKVPWRDLYGDLASGRSIRLNLVNVKFMDAEITPGGYLVVSRGTIPALVEPDTTGYVSRDAFRRNGTKVSVIVEDMVVTGFRIRTNRQGNTWLECPRESGNCIACLHEAGDCVGSPGCYFCHLDRHDSEMCQDDETTCLFCAHDCDLYDHEDSVCDPSTCRFCAESSGQARLPAA